MNTMDSPCLEKDGSALGGLFHQIITDLKNSTPLWEDFASKASKLHACLRTALQAISAYLEAFQKIADAATCARGATKDIGSALTRICLRHRAVEARVKTFTNAIMDCLVVPLQEKLEDWRKAVVNLDKEHAKEFKRARADLKKYSTDTLRLQKKARKGNSRELQSRVEGCLQDVTSRAHSLADCERRAVRQALTEERARFCQFYSLLEPVVLSECAVLGELSHLQDAAEQLRRLTGDPRVLPASSEQVVLDTKGWSPPGSPRSLGSRKSSACSISSLNSSSSGSAHALSPGQTQWQRSLSQSSTPITPTWQNRHSYLPGTFLSVAKSGPKLSRDSGFTSQDTLHSAEQVSNVSSHGSNGSGTMSTWPPQENPSTQANSETVNERPHTISSSYERGHQRPSLTVYTFQAMEQSLSQPASPLSATGSHNTLTRPPLPTRCSSLERPRLPNKDLPQTRNSTNTEKPRPSPLPAHLAKEIAQPTYVNMHELATLAANKAQNMQQTSTPQQCSTSQQSSTVQQQTQAVEISSDSSAESSSGYGSQIAASPNVQNQMGEISGQEIYSHYGTPSRRSSTTLPRPPPPVRRTSSISVQRQPLSSPSVNSMSNAANTPSTVNNMNTSVSSGNSSTGSNSDILPPPPSFLIDVPVSPVPSAGAVAETVKALTELRHTPASPSVLRRANPSLIQQPATSSPKPMTKSITETQSEMSPSSFGQKFTYTDMNTYNNVPVCNNTNIVTNTSSFNMYGQNVEQKIGHVGQNIGQVNQQIGHNSAQQESVVHQQSKIYSTPKVLSSFSSVNEGKNVSPNSSFKRDSNPRSSSIERRESTGVLNSGFMAQLSARLAPQLSPRTSRKSSDSGLTSSTNSMNKLPGKLPPAVLQRGGHGFIEQLNAKLAQQQVVGGPKANVVRQIINNTAQPDPTVCHDSLMEQIKRGATLKRNRTVNDRSAPKIH